jgi:hypothetical protein
MEAKELPKFIPMTVCCCCCGGISIGASALPFGSCPLRGILGV